MPAGYRKNIKSDHRATGQRKFSDSQIEEIILFGSYAEGTPKEYSDIDLAVISDWFKGKPRIENMQYLSRIAASYNSLIEALPFTEEEYRNLDKRSFLASIIQSGRRSSELIDKSV